MWCCPFYLPPNDGVCSFRLWGASGHRASLGPLHARVDSLELENDPAFLSRLLLLLLLLFIVLLLLLLLLLRGFLLVMLRSESVFMFLRDSDTGILSAGTQVSYSCMTSESSSHVFTFMVRTHRQRRDDLE